MIRIEPVKEIPAEVVDNLKPYSRHEYVVESARTLATTDVWAVYEDETPLFCFGVEKRGLLGSAYFWILVCKAYTLKHLLATPKYLRPLMEYYGGLFAAIEVGAAENRKFAEVFGFKQTSMTAEMFGRSYTIYEARS